MKTIVTGARGLLGSAIHREVGDENGLYPTRDELNLMFIEDVATYFNEHKNDSDTIIHCAARVGGVKANMDDNDGFFRDNYIMNRHLLEIAYHCDYKNLISILSTCVFPDKVEYPLTADKIDLGPPHPSNYRYSYSKRMLNYQTMTFGKMADLNWKSIIPTNLYGINDNFDLNDSHLIPALIRKAYEAKRDGTDFEVWGDGKPLRQFVFSDDMAKIILWAKDNWKKDVPMMAVNEKEYSISEVAHIIAEKFDFPKEKIRFNKNMPSGQFRKPAKSDVKDFEFTPLEEGISKTVDWFVENYESGSVRL
jgi:GDP-L-fucose synthase